MLQLDLMILRDFLASKVQIPSYINLNIFVSAITIPCEQRKDHGSSSQSEPKPLRPIVYVLLLSTNFRCKLL